MKHGIRYAFLLSGSLILLGMSVMTACSTVSPEMKSSQATLGMEPDFSYSVVEQQPSVHVDRYGYGMYDKKLVFVTGREIDKNFELREADGDGSVFQGKLKKIRSDKYTDVYMGDFSEWEQEGNYYIYNSTLGDSYEFKISGQIYQELFSFYFRMFGESIEDTVDCRVYSLANLLFTKELFPQTPVAEGFLKQEIEIIRTELEDGKADSCNEQAEMAGLLAQSAFLYRGSDPVFAQQCLNSSQVACQKLEKENDLIRDDIRRYLLAELFRATGGYHYKNAIVSKKLFENRNSREDKHDFTILSDFAYLGSSNCIDYEKCKEILNFYLRKAQKISENSSRENLYVVQNADQLEYNEVLEYLMVLGIENYMLSGREYEVVQKNYIHYFLGGNEQNRNQLMDEAFLDQMECEDYSQLLFIIGSLCH